MANYPAESDVITETAKGFAQGIEFFFTLLRLQQLHKINGTLVLDPATGEIVTSSLIDEMFEGQNEVIRQLAILVDGQTVTGAAAFKLVLAKLFLLPVPFEDSMAAFMNAAVRCAK